MILHESPQDFKDAVEAAAQHFNLRPVFIEKDYWVTYVLRNLAQSEYADKVVFKGGTSLSKAYNCIKRFSEDIDLAILSPANYNGNQLSKLLKSVTAKITGGLKLIPGHPSENKLGKIRATVYEYNKLLGNNDFGIVTEYILVEINCFANPVPYNPRPIQSYVAQYLIESGNQHLVEEYGLQPFNVNVLSLERTYFEKILSVNRLSYEGWDKVQKKVRHFYDIHQLHHHPELQGRILTPEHYNVVASVRNDDETNRTMNGVWKGQTLASSPLFSNLEGSWEIISGEYNNGLRDLIWSTDMPPAAAVLEVLREVKEYVRLFDTAYPPAPTPELAEA